VAILSDTDVNTDLDGTPILPPLVISRPTGPSREEVLKQGIIRSKIPPMRWGSGLAMPVISDLARQDHHQQ
jgi:hypothetical protein